MHKDDQFHTTSIILNYYIAKISSISVPACLDVINLRNKVY